MIPPPLPRAPPNIWERESLAARLLHQGRGEVNGRERRRRAKAKRKASRNARKVQRRGGGR